MRSTVVSTYEEAYSSIEDELSRKMCTVVFVIMNGLAISQYYLQINVTSFVLSSQPLLQSPLPFRRPIPPEPQSSTVKAIQYDSRMSCRGHLSKSSRELALKASMYWIRNSKPSCKRSSV